MSNLPPPLGQAYAMITFIPYFLDDEGGIWLEPLWHRDFSRHLTYILNLTLVAPQRRVADAKATDLIKVEVPPGVTLRWVPLPAQDSRLGALLGLPRTAQAIWSAVSQAQIVHTGVVGWPYPLGWLAGLAAIAHKKSLMILVESAPWRFKDGASLGRRVEAQVNEVLARWLVNHAAISFFTQPNYQETMLTKGRGPGWVIPATWIDEHEVLDRATAEQGWRNHRAGPVRLLVPTRLSADKGIQVLIEAIRLLREQGVVATIDIIGEGALHDACAACAAAGGSTTVRLLTPVPYGAPFFSLLRQYQAVLVPNLGDEQPRIVFDAYAQALPVIASDSVGLKPHVSDGETGWLVTKGDPAALAAAIAKATEAPQQLEAMGLAALARAASMTHMQMHLDRWRRLVDTLGA